MPVGYIPPGIYLYCITSFSIFHYSERLQKLTNPAASLPQMVHRVRIRDTHMTLAALAEGAARNDRDLLLVQQSLAEFVTGKSGGLD